MSSARYSTAIPTIVAAATTICRRRSAPSMALIEPNRKLSRSPDCEADGDDITTTAKARKPTNSTPIDVSSGNGENCLMALTPRTITIGCRRRTQRGAEPGDGGDGDAG